MRGAEWHGAGMDPFDRARRSRLRREVQRSIDEIDATIEYLEMRGREIEREAERLRETLLERVVRLLWSIF